MRVYHRVAAGRPLRAAWMLEEVGVPYELAVLGRDEARGADHLARHPLGRVPVLEDGDELLFESTAVCLHLADRYPERGLIAGVGEHDRALAYQWTMFAMTEVEPALVQARLLSESAPEVAAQAAARCAAAVDVVEEALATREYLVGDAFTVADVVLGETVRLATVVGALRERTSYPRVTDYLATLARRPARQRAVAKFAQGDPGPWFHQASAWERV